MDRIFVQIASYRDPECQWTVKDLFEKAKYPDRISVGICWQYDPDEDDDCFKISVRPEQVRIAPFHWKESLGVCWARYQVQQLWEGEEYALFIDSHMRFEKDWDELLIQQLAECPSPKPVLSNHPACYTPPDDLQLDATPTILRANMFTVQGDLRNRGANLDRFPDKPLNGIFIAGGFMFAKSNIIEEVPYDPHLYFDQEEISLAIRLFTHGFDIFSLKNVLLYHYYRTGPDPKMPNLFWQDNSDWLRLQERGRKRLDHLLGLRHSDNPEIVRDMMKYDLGSERTFEEFEAYSGIDFKDRKLSDKALRAGFIKDLNLYMDQRIFIPEIDGELPSEMPAPTEAPLLPVETNAPTAAPVLTNPYERLAATPGGSTLNVDRSAPDDVLLVYDYLDKEMCEKLKRYADSEAFTELRVVDPNKSTKNKVAEKKDDGRITHHVEIDGMAHEIITIFNDIYCSRLAAFYNANFEWYERPQILRYPPGGKYNQHADADNWNAETDTWKRDLDRDYSVLLYLNEDYGGGEIELINHAFSIKPKTGMLLAFPSDHRFLHAAHPTTSGIRYVIVSWAAIMGSRRVRPKMPPASVYIRQKRKA